MAVTPRLLPTLCMACTIFLSSPRGAGADDFWMLFQNHRVTLTARDVSVSQILERWAQVGGTVVVNGAAIQGGPIALQLTDVPEREALEILLRGVGGYIVVDREDDSTGASSISKILILPRSAASRNQPTANAVAFDPASSTQPVETRAEQTFPAPPVDTFQPAAPPLPAGLQYVPPALLPVPVVAGTSRPGEATPQAPMNFRPGQTPSGQPGQMAPMVNTIQQTGPGSEPPPAVVPGAR
jgi:hypothetical protein